MSSAIAELGNSYDRVTLPARDSDRAPVKKALIQNANIQNIFFTLLLVKTPARGFLRKTQVKGSIEDGIIGLMTFDRLNNDGKEGKFKTNLLALLLLSGSCGINTYYDINCK